MARIVIVGGAGKLDDVRLLFDEYGEWLGDHICAKSFAEEMASLPGQYAEPAGTLLVAYCEDEPAGCVALRRHVDAETCEMKRLYVRPRFRGLGVGEKLIDAIVGVAQDKGYRRVRLDTFPERMGAAVHLYRQKGFNDFSVPDAQPGLLYMELILQPESDVGAAR